MEPDGADTKNVLNENDKTIKNIRKICRLHDIVVSFRVFDNFMHIYDLIFFTFITN